MTFDDSPDRRPLSPQQEANRRTTNKRGQRKRQRARLQARVAELEAGRVTLRHAVHNLQPPEDAHEIWKHGFLVACQGIVAIIDSGVTDG